MATIEEARRRQEEGKDLYRHGEYEEAVAAFSQARHLFAEVGDRTGEAEALGNIGVVYVQLEEWDEARRFLNEALDLCIAAGDRSNQAKVMGNLGMLYARQGDEEQAVEAYEQAMALFRELGDEENEKAVARQVSRLKLKKGRFLEALAGYQEEIAGAEASGGAPKIARRLFRLLGRLTGGAARGQEEGGPGEELSESEEE